MNTTAITHWAALQAALDRRQPLWVTYHGHPRLLCPHTLGWHHTTPMLLAYQTSGHTSRGHLDPDPHRRWRCLRIDHIDTIKTADTTWASADNYNPTAPFPNKATTLSAAIETAG